MKTSKIIGKNLKNLLNDTKKEYAPIAASKLPTNFSDARAVGENRNKGIGKKTAKTELS